MTRLAASPDALVMTPGTYLRLRREAAGVSIDAVARATVSSPVDIAAAVEALTNAEADRELIGDPDLFRLGGVIRLDPAIYLGLVDGRVAVGICRRCGCTWRDACQVGSVGCAWADRAETLCTACLEPRP